MSSRGLPRGAELFQPMLATAGKDVPAGAAWVFEPKYDGIRILALLSPDAVALITRNGHDKCRQFPEITSCLQSLARKLNRLLSSPSELAKAKEAALAAAEKTFCWEKQVPTLLSAINAALC